MVQIYRNKFFLHLAPVPAQLARCCLYTNSVQAIRLCRVCRVCRPVSCLLSISILLSHKTLTDDRERNVEKLTTLLSQSLRAGGIDNMYLRSQSKINIILCQTRPCLHSVGSLQTFNIKPIFIKDRHPARARDITPRRTMI